MLIVLLPAYNEGRSLALLLDRFSALFEEHFPHHRVIVIDDGSSDETAEAVRSYRPLTVELVQHEKNKGVGAAVKTGMLRALADAEDNDILVRMDADNTHNPFLIVRMAQLIQEGHDVVIASRYAPGAQVVGVSWARQLFSYVASILFRFLFPMAGVRDYTSDYRAYRVGILKQAFSRWGEDFISHSGFDYAVDSLLKLRPLEALITEVPLILRYDFKRGESKMDVAKTVKDTLGTACRHWLRGGD